MPARPIDGDDPSRLRRSIGRSEEVRQGSDKNQVSRANDWANLVFGAALFIAPWLYGYSGVERVAVTGWATGAAMFRFAEWEEWVGVLLGVWIFAAPFALSRKSVDLAVQVQVLIGILLVVSTGLKLWPLHQVAPAASEAS